MASTQHNAFIKATELINLSNDLWYLIRKKSTGNDCNWMPFFEDHFTTEKGDLKLFIVTDSLPSHSNVQKTTIENWWEELETLENQTSSKITEAKSLTHKQFWKFILQIYNQLKNLRLSTQEKKAIFKDERNWSFDFGMSTKNKRSNRIFVFALN